MSLLVSFRRLYWSAGYDNGIRKIYKRNSYRSNTESLRITCVIGCEGSGQQVENGPYRAEYEFLKLHASSCNIRWIAFSIDGDKNWIRAQLIKQSSETLRDIRDAYIMLCVTPAFLKGQPDYERSSAQHRWRPPSLRRSRSIVHPWA